MKKFLLIIQLLVATMLYPTMSYAHGDDHDHHGHHGWRHRHHDNQDWGHHRNRGYYPEQQVNNYYPQHQGNYYPQAQPQYYGPQPRHYGYDPRSHQGLAGGVIGSVFGYEIGRGDPIAAGIGAAAGSFLGNGFGGR